VFKWQWPSQLPKLHGKQFKFKSKDDPYVTGNTGSRLGTKGIYTTNTILGAELFGNMIKNNIATQFFDSLIYFVFSSNIAHNENIEYKYINFLNPYSNTDDEKNVVFSQDNGDNFIYKFTHKNFTSVNNYFDSNVLIPKFFIIVSSSNNMDKIINYINSLESKLLIFS